MKKNKGFTLAELLVIIVIIGLLIGLSGYTITRVIKQSKENIKVLSTFNGKIIAIQQEKNIAISFHPELTENTLIHEYFIKNIL